MLYVVCDVCMLVFIFFFKQKTAYEMRISDWSSDVCSSDRVEAARAAYLASAAARDAATLSVAAATASGYITLLGLDARREVVRLTISSRAEALRLARSRANAGYTSELELRQAEAEYEAAAQIL